MRFFEYDRKFSRLNKIIIYKIENYNSLINSINVYKICIQKNGQKVFLENVWKIEI